MYQQQIDKEHEAEQARLFERARVNLLKNHT